MSIPENDPIQPKMCPECCKTDRTLDAAGWRDAHDTLMGLMARGLRGNR